jgi:hypothetical protein
MCQRSQQKNSSVEIDVAARGDRRALEALYLELRELGRQTGLKVELQLTRSGPQDKADC